MINTAHHPSIPLFFTGESFAVPGATTPSSGCRGEPHCDCWRFSVAQWRRCWGGWLCSAESHESELLGSSPSEQAREQKMRPPRGRKGRPSRGSRQRSQQKHASTACQCCPS